MGSLIFENIHAWLRCYSILLCYHFRSWNFRYYRFIRGTSSDVSDPLLAQLVRDLNSQKETALDAKVRLPRLSGTSRYREGVSSLFLFNAATWLHRKHNRSATSSCHDLLTLPFAQPTMPRSTRNRVQIGVL